MQNARLLLNRLIREAEPSGSADLPRVFVRALLKATGAVHGSLWSPSHQMDNLDLALSLSSQGNSEPTAGVPRKTVPRAPGDDPVPACFLARKVISGPARWAGKPGREVAIPVFTSNHDRSTVFAVIALTLASDDDLTYERIYPRCLIAVEAAALAFAPVVQQDHDERWLKVYNSLAATSERGVKGIYEESLKCFGPLGAIHGSFFMFSAFLQQGRQRRFLLNQSTVRFRHGEAIPCEETQSSFDFDIDGAYSITRQTEGIFEQLARAPYEYRVVFERGDKAVFKTPSLRKLRPSYVVYMPLVRETADANHEFRGVIILILPGQFRDRSLFDHGRCREVSRCILRLLNGAVANTSHEIYQEVTRKAHLVLADFAKFNRAFLSVVRNSLGVDGATVFRHVEERKRLSPVFTSGLRTPKREYDLTSAEDRRAKTVRAYRLGNRRGRGDALPQLYFGIDDEEPGMVQEKRQGSELSFAACHVRGLGRTAGVIRCVNKRNAATGNVVPFRREDVKLMRYVGELFWVFWEIHNNYATRTSYISILPHEIRMPADGILARTDEIRRRGMTQLTHDKMGDILSDIEAHAETISSIMDNATLVNEEVLALRQEPLLLFDSIVYPWVETFRSLAGKREVYIDEPPLSVVTRVPPLFLDKNRIRQAFYNVLSNALKYCYNRTRIVVECERMGERIELRVTDHGVGFRKDEESRLTELNFRSGDAQALSATGTGIGLHVTERIMKAHGGEVSCHAEQISEYNLSVLRDICDYFDDSSERDAFIHATIGSLTAVERSAIMREVRRLGDLTNKAFVGALGKALSKSKRQVLWLLKRPTYRVTATLRFPVNLICEEGTYRNG